MEKDRSQYLHLYGCSPVCVLRWRVRLADRGNTFPQNLHEYLSFFAVGVPEGGIMWSAKDLWKWWGGGPPPPCWCC